MKITLLIPMLGLIGCADSNKTEAEETASDETTDTETPDQATPVELQPGINELTIDQVVEGETVERSYIVHLPESYDGTASTPLLFAFHGNGGEPYEFIEQFGPPVSSGEFIGVYPTGIAASWNIGREESTADDVAFTASLLAALEGLPGIDTSRPVAMGFSNGAALVQKIAVETDLFVGIVPQVSQLLVENPPQSEGAKVSVMQFNGTVDMDCPYDGGSGAMGHVFMSAEGSAAAWAEHNGCDSTATETVINEHLKMEWENCEEGRRVIHYKLNDVGHAVPPNIDGGSNARLVEFLLEARQ